MNTEIMTRKKQSLGSGRMFDRIATRYDRLNRIMSFGMDRWWRRKLVRSIGPLTGNCRILDVATGTADVALALSRYYSDSQTVGLDPSEQMVAIGKDKIQRKKLADRINLVIGDAQNMDFPTDAFDGATIAFGIRNVPDRLQGLREMTRVTRPGGKIAILELTEPRRGLMAPFARFHVHHIVPRLGAFLSGEKEYRYLQESIQAFPAPDVFGAMMEEAGLVHVTLKRFAFGSVHLFVGEVPPAT